MQDDRYLSFYNRAICKNALADFKGAEEDFTTAITLAPDIASNWGKRARTRTWLRDFDRAKSDFARSLELDPRNSEVWYDVGILRQELGDIDGGIAACDKSLEIDPGANGTYEFRAKFFLDKGNFVRAQQDLDKAILLNPRIAVAYHRGLARDALNDRAGALSDYSKTLELDPRFARAWVNRGLLKYDNADHAGAMADFDRAIEIDPKIVQAYLNRAVVFFHQKNGEAASPIFNP